MPRDPIKVYDARWEASEFSDAEVTRLFEATLAYGREIGVDTVTLSRDGRLAGGHVMELGMNAALRLGFRVFVRPEPVSTPQGYFTALWVSQRHPKTMGLVITASHNPAQYIGVKFTVPTVEAIGQDCGPKGGLTRVRELYHSLSLAPLLGAGRGWSGSARPGEGTHGRPGASGAVVRSSRTPPHPVGLRLPPSPRFRGSEQRGEGELHLLDLTREYIDFSLKAAGVKPGDLSGVKVVLDAYHGSAGPEIYQALVKAGATVHPIRLITDGHFPTGSPNPTSQGKMNAAVAWARANKYDVVIGVDGDGDRIVFGDRRGILTAGFVTVPVLRAAGVTHLKKPAPVLYDPKVSPLALAEWGKLGVRPVLFRNGHSQIKDYMKKIGAPAASEESGHYYHRIRLGKLAVTSENSIMTILFFLGTIARPPEGRKVMDQLWAMEKKLFTTGEFNYQFDSDGTRDQAMAAVIAHFVGQGAATVTATPDGIDLQGTVLSQGVHLDPGHVKLDKGWYSGYLRIATNEKGVVRSYFSAADKVAGKQIEGKTREILENQFGGTIID